MLTFLRRYSIVFFRETIVKRNRNTMRITITERYETLSFLCLLPYISDQVKHFSENDMTQIYSLSSDLAGTSSYIAVYL